MTGPPESLPATERGASRALLLALAGAGILLTAASVALAAHNAAPHDRFAAIVLHGLIVAAPLVVGFCALRGRASDRFGGLLVVAAFAFSLTALAESRDPVPYSVGRVALWAAEPLLIYLILSFPSGRLPGRPERLTTIAAAVVSFGLYLPTVLLATRFPQPNPLSTCDADCPENAFSLVSSTSGVVDVVRPLREVLAATVFGVAAVLVTRRTRRSGPLLRDALVPVAAVAWYRALALAAFFVARGAGAEGTGLDVIAWVWALALPLVALSFGVGLINRRLRAATVFRRLAVALRAPRSMAEVRDAMADALEDPSLRLVQEAPGERGHWYDDRGRPVAAPDSTVAVTEIQGGCGGVAAAAVHDPGTGQDPELVQTAASYAFVALENTRLVEQLHRTVDELAASRARVISEADAVRRDIERDLHDGAQQRLTALRVRLEITATELDADAPGTGRRLSDLGGEIDAAIEEIRNLARGIYPSLLTTEGLGAALRAAGRGSPLPATVRVEGVGRLRPELEHALYFSVVEALQNAARHADGATRVDVGVSRIDGHVDFEVRDDGAGFDAAHAAHGSGLTSLADRLAAVGGNVEVESAPGAGTRVAGRVPSS